jgi:hypothetical protein
MLAVKITKNSEIIGVQDYHVTSSLIVFCSCAKLSRAGWLATWSLVAAVAGHPGFESGSLLLMKKPGEGIFPWFIIFFAHVLLALFWQA